MMIPTMSTRTPSTRGEDPSTGSGPFGSAREAWARGRVGGAGGMIGYGLMPLGALLGGLVGEFLGLPAVFLGAVALSLLVVLYAATRVSTELVARHEIS